MEKSDRISSAFTVFVPNNSLIIAFIRFFGLRFFSLPDSLFGSLECILLPVIVVGLLELSAVFLNIAEILVHVQRLILGYLDYAARNI